MMGMDTALKKKDQAIQVDTAFRLEFNKNGEIWFESTATQHKRCAKVFNIKGLDKWCPETLMDIAQLTNYYKQTTIERTYQKFESHGWEFPNAIYIDALDKDGTIATGTTLIWGEDRDKSKMNNKRYPYVATLVGYNVKKACEGKEDNNKCKSFDENN